ncbi:MAG: YdcF family protein [Holdemanella sp.]|nr:YdcF family protein [Holdemanella sp.]
MIVKIVCIILLILVLIYIYFFPPIPKRKKKYPYALCLGCPNHNDGTLCTSQKKRSELAIKAYDQGYYDTLILSGGAVKNQYVESKEMEKYILEKRKDIPIICEMEARTTWENFQNTKKITGEVPILVITSQTHIKRACAMARSFYKEYSGIYYPDYKLKHIIREFFARLIYIRYEIAKKIK